MLVVVNVLAAVLAAIFLAVGFAKLLYARPLVAEFARFGYPRWSCPATGGLEVAGASLLIVGIAAGAGAGLLGVGLLTLVMIGALATHVRVGDHADKVAPPVILLLLLGTELALITAT